MISGFGLAAPTQEKNTIADLATLDSTLGALLEPGDYYWGVLLVQREPYQRLQYLGGGYRFSFDRSSSSSGGGASSGE